MRYKLLAALLVAAVALPGVASAKSPGGSKESSKNQVKCGAKPTAASPTGGKLYAGSSGVEYCDDNNSAPDGRVIVSFDERYIAADGDANNPGASTGFVRIEQSGVSCSEKKKQDASKGKGGTCG